MGACQWPLRKRSVGDGKRPLQPGDVVVIYCSGLGEVDAPAEAGPATPIDRLRNAKSPIRVTIGGVAAVVQFAGLNPGGVGLYQVNATVPAGVTSGSAVPLILSFGSISSLPVSVAVQ